MARISAEELIEATGQNPITRWDFLGYLFDATQSKKLDFDGNPSLKLVALENAVAELFAIEYERKHLYSYESEDRLSKLREYSTRSVAAWEVIKENMFEVIPTEI